VCPLLSFRRLAHEPQATRAKRPTKMAAESLGGTQYLSCVVLVKFIGKSEDGRSKNCAARIGFEFTGVVLINAGRSESHNVTLSIAIALCSAD
jgi:hypothetical protein